MRYLVVVMLLWAGFVTPAVAGLAEFLESLRPLPAPKTAKEVFEREMFKNVRVVESGGGVEITLKDKDGLDELSYSFIARAVLKYGKFEKSKGNAMGSVLVWHYSDVTDIYGNTEEMRTGSLKWSSMAMKRFNYEKGDWHMFINLAEINDLPRPGYVSIKGLCKKSYASLYGRFCQRFDNKLWQQR